MKKSILTASILSALSCGPAYAGHWRVGPDISYVSGIDDISKLYERNYNATHSSTQADVTVVLPIGLGVQGTYTWDSGVRLDMQLGPLFRMSSNSSQGVDPHLDHTEVPVSATLGFTFLPNSSVAPYLRAGFAYHFASGTYVRSANPGLLGAAGIEFARKSIATYSLEVATDRSAVEFDRYQSPPSRHDIVKLNTYDWTISFIVKF